MNNKEIFLALVQNYSFKKAEFNKLPVIAGLYPDYAADGISEDFRFYESLRVALAERTPIVKNALKDKLICWTNEAQLLLEIDKIAPRLSIEEQMRVNSIFVDSLLFLGFSENEFSAFVIKPIVNYRMYGFEFTKEEADKIYVLFAEKARQKPFLSFFQKIKKVFKLSR